MRAGGISMLLFFALAWGLVLPVQAEIPRVISYQGRVTDTTGTPVANGNYVMRFFIYDGATAGTQLWDSGARLVQVTGGVFSVLLGDSPQPTITLAFDDDYWLQVYIAGDVQSPRVRLGSVGYAYMASGVVPGTEVSGAVITGTSAAFKGVNTAASGERYGLQGISASSAGHGVSGASTAGSGITYGVYGEAASTEGRGVFGWGTATYGVNFGVSGLSSSNSGYGVYGLAGAAVVRQQAVSSSRLRRRGPGSSEREPRRRATHAAWSAGRYQQTKSACTGMSAQLLGRRKGCTGLRSPA